MRTLFKTAALTLAIAHAGAATAGFCDEHLNSTYGEPCVVQNATYTPPSLSRYDGNVFPDFSTLDLKPFFNQNPTMEVEFTVDLSNINLKQSTTPGVLSPTLTVFELGIRSVNDDGSGSDADYRVLALKVALSPGTSKANQLYFVWRTQQIDWANREPEGLGLEGATAIDATTLAAGTTTVQVKITPTDPAWSGVTIAAFPLDGAANGIALVPPGSGFRMPPDVTWTPGMPEAGRVNRPEFLRVGVLGGDLQRPGMTTVFGVIGPYADQAIVTPIEGTLD